jgi:predicted ATPase
MDLDAVNVFVGENGAGKSNLYRAMQLIHAAATGSFASEIAGEGGMSSVLWSGRRRQGAPVRIGLEADLFDDEADLAWTYRIEAGLKPPAAAGFAFEPQIKTEVLTVAGPGSGARARPAAVMKRDGSALHYRREDGRMAEYPVRLLPSETALMTLGGSGLHAEVAIVREALSRWRFYHGFRTDSGSPLRAPCLAVTAPMLEMDGGNLAAVFATLAHVRGDTVDLDRAVSDAFNGATLSIPEPGMHASFGMVQPAFPQREFSARELSDGQIRFLGLAAALLAYRLPPLIALNEPESSLHPDMLPALAAMIERASMDAQIWVVTHAPELATLLDERLGIRARTVMRQPGGETWIEGMSLAGAIRDEADDEEDG